MAFATRYIKDPVAFVREILHAEPDRWQREFLEAIARGDRRISIRSGHGVGKSTAASWAAIWYQLTRFPVKIVVTAPTKAQLYDALFAEMRVWIDRLPPELRSLLDVKSDSVSLVPSPAGSFISVRTSRAETPEAMAGVHSEHVMLIGDEASGIVEQVFEAAAGSMSGANAVTILLGNPVRPSGYFFETHTKLKDHWTTMHVSCYDSTRVDPRWIEEMRVKYGENSNPFRVRVLGEFPLSDDGSIIPYELVQTSLGRDIVVSPTIPVIWGLDVARGGADSAVLTERQGRRLLAPPTGMVGLDLMQLALTVAARYNATPDKLRPAVIAVDGIGMGGGVTDRLRELGLPARSINVAESRVSVGVYHNLRAELWYKMRAWFSGRDVHLPALEPLNGSERESMDRLVEELTTTRQDFMEASGKIIVEPKKRIRQRLNRSPDRADSLMLTFAAENLIALHGRDIESDWKKPLKRGLKIV